MNARDVCMDADVAPRRKGCVVYSIGLRDNWSFEEDMEDIGCEVSDPASSGTYCYLSYHANIKWTQMTNNKIFRIIMLWRRYV